MAKIGIGDGLHGKSGPPFNPSHGPVYALNSNVSKSRRRGRAFPFRNIQATLCLLLPSDTYPRGCTGPLVIAIVKSITITRAADVLLAKPTPRFFDPARFVLTLLDCLFRDLYALQISRFACGLSSLILPGFMDLGQLQFVSACLLFIGYVFTKEIDDI